MEYLPIKKIKTNPNNPRVINNENFQKLVKSITEFPKMLELRPLVIDENNIVLGGNMRLKACTEAGLKKIPVLRANELSEKEKERFIITDNVSYGEWDEVDLVTNWNLDELDSWGLKIELAEKLEEKIEGEVEFSEFLDEENNYVVLFFNNRMDWLQAQTHFDLKTVSSKRSNGKPWSKGVGRVINGTAYLKSLHDE